MKIKCILAFIILAAVLALLVYALVKCPALIILIAASCVVTWAIFQAAACLD